MEAIAKLPERFQEKIKNYTPRYSWEPNPFAPYALSNSNANIKRVKERIAYLERIKATEKKEYMIGDARIVHNTELNRVQILFPGKPAPEVRARLKKHGDGGTRVCVLESRV